MNFPRIETIDDLLPHVEYKKEIKHWDKSDYQVIDYVVGKKNTFRSEDGSLCPYLLECRGIKFDNQGRILARPFHKFFNLNETPETELQNVSWKDNPVLYEKYDGSMVHPAKLFDRFFLMTRSGITYQSEEAEKLLRRIDYDFFEQCDNMGVTPIYEFIGPDNLHVVKYDVNELVLLAMRHNVSGNYLNSHELTNYASMFDQGLSVHTSIPPDPTRVIEKLKEVKNFEGYVYVFPSGFRIKLKGPEYVLAHRAKSAADFEGKIIEMILREELNTGENNPEPSGLDDFYSILEGDQRKKFDEYRQAILEKINNMCHYIRQTCHSKSKISRKEFAEDILWSFKKVEAHFYFKYRDFQEGKIQELNLKEYIIEQLLKNVRGKNLERAKELLGVKWENPFNVEDAEEVTGE